MHHTIPCHSHYDPPPPVHFKILYLIIVHDLTKKKKQKIRKDTSMSVIVLLFVDFRDLKRAKKKINIESGGRAYCPQTDQIL